MKERETFMTITHKWTLVCDEVRQENNGKFIVIGLYTPNLAIPQIPFTMPYLTFFTCLETDRPGDFQFRMKLTHLESGRTVWEGFGGMGVKQPGIGVLPIRLPSVQFQSAGVYTFSFTLVDQPVPLFTTDFAVILNLPAQERGGPISG